jgi:hypothetical protein
MAGHDLNEQMAAPARAPIAAYLDDIGARLVGPRRRRRQILAELSDGLDQATDRRIAAGMPADRAADAAIVQFGGPAAVADAFADELITAYARRAVALYVITGPLVGIWWLLLLRPEPWRAGLTALLAVIPVLPLIVLTVATAGGTLATTGRLMRWLPEATPRQALTATLVTAGLGVAADITIVALLATSSSRTGPLAVAAVAASAIRTACGIGVVRTATRLRRAATHHDPH